MDQLRDLASILAGKALSDCENTTVAQFSPVMGNVPDIEQRIVDQLSTEQKYLFEMCQAIKSGYCAPVLANRQPGKMAHSRWVTTANRILRLYVGSSDPSENLKILVEYIVKVYAPVWFSIKNKPLLIDGANHVFELIFLSRWLPQNLKSIIDAVIQRNAFFAHPENILVAMLFDKRNYVKELALKRIFKARQETTTNRIFKPPEIKFNATDYIDIIFWNECHITSPPVLQDFSDEDLSLLLGKNELKIPDFPCHTQSVERCIKSVTEASQCVIGTKSRDGLIRNKIESRNKMPSFNFKGQFKM